MSDNKITIEADISSEIQKVWEYYTKPEHIINWNFASADWSCPNAENELKIGGKFLYRMEAKDGSFEFDFEGIYAEVIEHKKISYSMPDGREVETTFKDIGQAVLVSTSFDPENKNPIEMQREGWQAILHNFKKYVENN